MYNFIIALVNPNINFQLGFKEESMARAMRDKIIERKKEFEGNKTDGGITIKDDYGHHLDVVASNIAAILIQDHQAGIELKNDQNIDMARANDAFLKRRNEDMELIRLFPANNPGGQFGRA
jgi:ABC-type ATPase with predicted acetyltransferase domain